MATSELATLSWIRNIDQQEVATDKIRRSVQRILDKVSKGTEN